MNHYRIREAVFRFGSIASILYIHRMSGWKLISEVRSAGFAYRRRGDSDKSETMTFNYCCFAIVATTACWWLLQGVIR
jgi:hypothetical protein